MDDIIEVCCIVLPTGSCLWFKTEGTDPKYARTVLDKWKSEHPEFKGTTCTSGLVCINMTRDKYNKIGAKFGPNEFVYP